MKLKLLLLLLLLSTAVFAWETQLPQISDLPDKKLFDRVLLFDENELFENEHLKVSNIYPNPATTYVSFQYNLFTDVKAKIIIRNVLGSFMGEYPLTSGNNVLKISTEDFAAGIYFYTLAIDQKNMVTRKFLVRD